MKTLCTNCNVVLEVSDKKEKRRVNCPKCKNVFEWEPEYSNIQCYKCNHIDKYLTNGVELPSCTQCKTVFSGYATTQQALILKAVKDSFSTFPEKYENIKKLGTEYLTEVLKNSNELKHDMLKNGLYRFQESLAYFVEHLKRCGK